MKLFSRMNFQMVRVGLVASLIWTLVSCAATGDPFQRAEPIPGKASFYIYRVRAMTGAAFSWDVYLDDTKVAELRHGGYFYAPLSPGPHTIAVKVHTGLSLPFSAEADQTYYFRLKASTSFAEHRFAIERVDESLALYELSQMKLPPSGT
jgi:uncharacterized protein DUF2846